MSPPCSVTLCGRHLDRPGHICAFFDSRDEQYDVLAPFFKEGLDQGEQVITIVDADGQADHQRRLTSRGVAVDASLAGDDLRMLTSEDTYTSGGRFSAVRMYRLLQGALADARQHERRVRAAGVMDWSTRGYEGTGELMAYEARVNFLVPAFDCTLLCVYDLEKVDGRTLMDIMATHPYVVYRRQIKENPYYVPPIEVLRDVLLGDDGRATEESLLSLDM